MDAETRTTPAKPTPLSRWWIAAVIVIGVMATALAVGGMMLSFRAVSAEMAGTFGNWAWLVPIVIDLVVLVFSGVDLLLNRMRMGHVLARVAVYGATAGTICLNYSAGGSTAGRIAHILMPSVWVVFIELMRHIVRRLTGLADGTLREPIPVARWILAPWRTAKLWRRMVLWQTNSYPKALAQERQRLEAIARLQEAHGLFWRWRVTPLVRLELSLGERPSTRLTDNAPTGNPGKTEESSTETANPLTVQPPTDRQPEPGNNPSSETAKTPSTGKPEPRQTTTARPTAEGQTSTDTWVLIGKPVYERLRAENGKRPGETVFHNGLTDYLAKLIEAGELVGEGKDEKPELYAAKCSLSTAKRIRGEIEIRFPGILFGHALEDQDIHQQEGAA